MKSLIRKSPLFYVGDKYKLMKQLLGLFPPEINNFFEPFVGGGTVFLNIKAKKYFLNDINIRLIAIHKFLVNQARTPEKLYAAVEKIVKKYKLSRSYAEDIVPATLKLKFKKTFYAKFNQDGYNKLKACFNKANSLDPLTLYILLIYGFNRMLRFNLAGKFNLPVGNVDFNKNVVNALNGYFDFVIGKKLVFTSQDFRPFLLKREFQKNDFVYLDPPYLIGASEYNKLWNIKLEEALLQTLDTLNLKGVKFALSNLTHYNKSKNELLLTWMSKYKVHNINSRYISYHNNNEKKLKEVLITNY
ncbi:MAG: Dam family site-specific DNA-(adenine-N6)-methyltransferase [Candidatus Margulisbacteria bacterium]|jgi:DNA adenine methylase|nr:Dam family site-specific DNA-(adenine-N6)-methyltransferase [Candidatus Margulisiibacteriota bacterium]